MRQLPAHSRRAIASLPLLERSTRESRLKKNSDLFELVEDELVVLLELDELLAKLVAKLIAKLIALHSQLPRNGRLCGGYWAG